MSYKGVVYEENDNTPIIVGVAQWTNKSENLVDPLAMCVKTSLQAIEDAVGTESDALKEIIDYVGMTRIDSWSYEGGNGKLPCKLSETLGLSPRSFEFTKVGGETPQLMINKACLALENEEFRAILLTGCEALDSVKKVLEKRSKGENVDWPEGQVQIGATELSKVEASYGLGVPSRVYPMLETAIRENSGRTPEEHLKYIGNLFSKYSEVASKNPHAWFYGIKHSAEKISTPSPQNRMVCYPYTKLMNAFPMVNQSASVILTTVGHAKKLKIPEEKWVYPMGGAHFTDVKNVTERRNLCESPAVRNAANLSFRQAGVTINDIKYLDIYSCFPSAVQVAMKEIGISQDDPRPLTLTGGLPYFGGPGNNYSMHAIVSVTEKIRQDPTAKGLVYANGMFITKHAIGIYGKSKPLTPWSHQFPHFPLIQKSIHSAKLPPVIEKAEGIFKVEAYMISYHKKTFKPVYGVAIGTIVSSGRRAIANISGTTAELESFEKNELVGKLGVCSYDPKQKKNFVSFQKSNL